MGKSQRDGPVQDWRNSYTKASGVLSDDLLFGSKH